MSRLSDPTGMRVNRRPKFVAIDSKTVRDTSISYRALGLLGYLLDQKEGWQVRSDQLSKGEGREGRGAVRTALRELGKAGYYRLERRRLRDGKCVMGTAVSEYPVKQWQEDYKIFNSPSDPAVPVVEQEDGTFLVEYPDGTFGSDGFEPDLLDEEEPPADPEPEEADELEATAEEPPAAPEKPAARPRRTRRTPEQKAADDEEKAAEKKRKDEEKAALDAAAQAVAKWWWDHAEKHLGKYVGATNGFVAMRGMVRKALEAGYTQRQCADALVSARKHLPSAQQWQTALGVVTNHIIPSQPTGRIPYSDKATWGDHSDAPTSTPPGDAPSTPSDDSDNATFGVIARP
ncbi:hypothetical protein ACIBU0_42830 [Streptomyces sp. NPDC049627]|uniref:hypothetical protein n=1 Tax=Streptomyces sp. NPDC049627 TaxID=3365595 RepID=UPI0037B7BB59